MKTELQKDRGLRVGLVSLGCAKNLVDAELMLGALLQGGVEISNDPSHADAVIVNTCSFIDSAQEESVDAILESAEVRQATNRGQALVVSGCLPQRFRSELPKLLPEVDAFMGIDQVPRVVDIVREAIEIRKAKTAAGGPPPRRIRKAQLLGSIESLQAGKPNEEEPGSVHLAPGKSRNQTRVVLGSKVPAASSLIDVSQRPKFIPDYTAPRFRLTPRHFAYLKIAEGCNHPCSFCIIPSMRGSHRSRALDDVIAEARALIGDGVKEINLISQDSTYYGLDLRSNHSRAIASPGRFNEAVRALPRDSTTISRLLRELDQLPGDFWVRLLYTHPAHWTDELIATIAQCRKVVRYVDIPLQHIHPVMLERMRRETSREYIVDLLGRIRAGIPGIALRTTFIVGFPGETQEYFHSLLNFMQQTRFERLGVFAYSREDGTRAGAMAGQLPDKVRQRRREEAMALQREISQAICASSVGKTVRVLVEKQTRGTEIQNAQLSSWEHGLIRGADEGLQQHRGRFFVARGEADAPDIDGRVYVKGDLQEGDFAEVTITGHSDYDLFARPTKPVQSSHRKGNAG